MKTIGITGPTGAGKTTALRALTGLGAAVIDADAMYHELLTDDEALKKALTDRFGTDILDRGGQVVSKWLGAIVFSDRKALEDLNAILLVTGQGLIFDKANLHGGTADQLRALLEEKTGHKALWVGKRP